MIHLMEGGYMKRNFLMITVALGLLIPLAAFAAGNAGAANPHGSKGDPNASCGAGVTCADAGLPQSNGCNDSSSAHNPHCVTTTTTTTTTPTTPVTTAVQNQVSGNKKAAGGNAGVAAAASELPFTGIDATLLALMGGLLLTAGLGLRRLSRAPDPAMAMFVAGPAGRGDESLPIRPFMG
jgi:hypothetical protein